MKTMAMLAVAFATILGLSTIPTIAADTPAAPAATPAAKPAAPAEKAAPAPAAEIKTVPPAGFVAIAKVEVGPRGGLLVNGKPFLPIMNFYQSPESFKHAAAMGLNAYFFPGSKPSSKEYLDTLEAFGLYGMVPFDAAAIGHPSLLAWLQPHEPDAAALAGKPNMSAQDMLAAYDKIKKADASRPVVLDFSTSFSSVAELSKDIAPDKKKDFYAAYAKAADILTYNVYPIWAYNKPANINWVAKLADDLRAIAGPRQPFFAMIETGKGWREIPVEKQTDVSPIEIRAEVWLALTHGATGIIYFTHRFTPKPTTEFAPDAEKQAAIKLINSELTQLAPAILGAAPKAKVTMTFDAASWFARELDGALYIFVVNADMDRQPGKAVIAVEGLKAGVRVEVVNENRLIDAVAGQFTDDFAPLAVHIYKLKL